MYCILCNKAFRKEKRKIMPIVRLCIVQISTLDMLEIQKSGIRQVSLDFFFTCPESHRRPHHSCWTSAASVPPLPYYWNYCPWRIPSFERQGSHRSQHTYPPYYITKSLFCRQPRRGALRELLTEIWKNPLFRENFVYYFFW